MNMKVKTKRCMVCNINKPEKESQIVVDKWGYMVDWQCDHCTDQAQRFADLMMGYQIDIERTDDARYRQ